MKIYNYIQYMGDTIYTKKVYKYGWYTKVSETFLTKDKIYKLLIPYEYNSLLYDDVLYIEDDLILNKPTKFENEYDKYSWDNYDGGNLIRLEWVKFISNREHNLNTLI